MIRQLIGITTTPLNLNHNIQKASLSIESQKPKLDISTELPKLEVKKDPMQLHIDYEPMNESLDIYKPVALAKKIAAEGRNAVMEAIENFSSEGRSMMDSLGKSWPQLALKRSGDRGMVEVETAYIPARPNISWSGTGTVDLNWTSPKLNINAEVYLGPKKTYNPYKVDISVARWHDVQIAYNGTVSDLYKLNGETMQKLNMKV